MYTALRQRLVIQPGGVIEIRSPDLPDGGVAEVTVRLVVTARPKPAISVRSRRPEDLGWPPGFFAETYGVLRDMPLVREPQGDYEVRDELR